MKIDKAARLLWFTERYRAIMPEPSARITPEVRKVVTAFICPASGGNGLRLHLMSRRPADMPASPDDLSILLDAARIRNRLETRAEVWRAIGIDPKAGRQYLARNNKHLNWPIWFTLREFALGKKE